MAFVGSRRALLGTSLQPEVQTYLGLVGGGINGSVIAALNRFVTVGKSAGWWPLLVEVYPFCGNSLTAALVKLKTFPSAATSLTNNNFVAGDYSQTAGFGNASANANKYLQTGVNWAGMGLSNTNGCQFSFNINQASAAGVYTIGDSPASGDSILFESDTNIGATSVSSLNSSRSGISARVWSVNSSNYLLASNGQLFNQSNTTFGSFTSNTNINLFARTFGASLFYAKSVIGITGFGKGLTAAQAQSLSLAMYQFENSVRNLMGSKTKRAAWLGDSIEYGTQATVTTAQFSNIVSTDRGWLEYNFGVPNSQLTNNASSGGSFAVSLLNRYTSIYQVAQFDRVIVMIGTNDQQTDVTTNGDGTLIATYQTNLTTVLTALAAQYGAGNVYVVSPQWSTAFNSTKNGAWNTGMSNAASAAGVTFIDFYTVFVNAGSPAGWTANATHPNNTGMSNIASTIEAAIAS